MANANSDGFEEEDDDDGKGGIFLFLCSSLDDFDFIFMVDDFEVFDWDFFFLLSVLTSSKALTPKYSVLLHGIKE